MTPFLISLSQLQPSQLYVSEDKLAAVRQGRSASGLPAVEPIPVKKLCGLTVCTDGHTRALAAHLAGSTQVPAAWDEDDLDWDAYEICVRWCRDEGINGIPDLTRRIVSGATYERLWLDRCRQMHEELDRQRAGQEYGKGS